MMPPSPNSAYVMARFAATEARYAPRSGVTPGGERVGAATPEGGATAAGPGGAGRVPVMPPGVTYVGALQRATGTRHVDHLGRDHLGPVLVSGRPGPDAPPE